LLGPIGFVRCRYEELYYEQLAVACPSGSRAVIKVGIVSARAAKPLKSTVERMNRRHH
jgi:hypothetical protein